MSSSINNPENKDEDGNEKDSWPIKTKTELVTINAKLKDAEYFQKKLEAKVKVRKPLKEGYRELVRQALERIFDFKLLYNVGLKVKEAIKDVINDSKQELKDRNTE